MKVVSRLASTPCPDPLVFTSPGTASAHRELLSTCERLESIWDERMRNEFELYKALKLELAKTSNVDEALRAYSENAVKRMRIALENAQRIFEEHQAMAARFLRRSD